LSAALVAALSPSLVFFSRYCIHEPLLVFETLGLALAILWWRTTRHPLFWYLAALCLTGLVTTKESFPLVIAALGAAVLAIGGAQTDWATLRAQRLHVFLAYLVLVFLVFLIFSAGFRWPDGIVELFAAIPQWVRRSSAEAGHFKPWFYYLDTLI